MWKLLSKNSKSKEKKISSSISSREPSQASTRNEESSYSATNATPPLGRRVVDVFRTNSNDSNRNDGTRSRQGLKNAIIQNVRRSGSFEAKKWTVKERDQR